MSSLQVTNEVRAATFLTAFSKTGTIRGAVRLCESAEGTGVIPIRLSRSVIRQWLKTNYLGMADRLNDAMQDYREYLEGLALDYVKDLKAGQNPTMLIALLNANYSEKWRRNEIQGGDDPRESLAAVRVKLKELQGGTVEVDVIAGARSNAAPPDEIGG